MVSVVSVCNRALSKIGDEIQIASLDDSSKPARYCKILYPEVRDMVLRSYLWRFALKRYLLAPLCEKPLFDWIYLYAVPADCLRVWRAAGDVAYQVEGKRILCNENPFAFTGVSRVENPDDFDSFFVEALALKLAGELAVPLAASVSLKSELAKEYADVVRQARTLSAMEGAQETFTPLGWLESRG